MKPMVSYLLMLQKYKFQARDSEIKDYALGLGNISKDFKIMENAGSKVVLKFFLAIFQISQTFDEKNMR